MPAQLGARFAVEIRPAGDGNAEGSRQRSVARLRGRVVLAMTRLQRADAARDEPWNLVVDPEQPGMRER